MYKNLDLGVFVLRMAIGVLMLFHGIAKLKGIQGIENMLINAGLPAIMAYGVYLTEIIAPILIIIGFRTRLASAVYTYGVLFAIALVHSGDLFKLNPHGGWGIELLGLYLFGAIALFFTGGGQIALSSLNKWD